MMERCLTEGAIQAFLDGELRAEALDAVTSHIALCDDCAIALSEAEDETAFAYSALEQEFNALVPTQRLWAKINCSIEEERKSKSAWHRILAGVSVMATQLSRPSVAAFASLFLVVGTFSTLWFMRPMPNNDLVNVQDDFSGAIEIAKSPAVAPPTFVKPAPQDQPENTVSDIVEPVDEVRVIQASNRENTVNRSINTNNINNKRPNNIQRENSDIERPTVTTLEYVPGEDSYVKTIATLKSSLDGTKDLNMKPSARFAIEKDLAVIDDAINKMKEEVRKNPKNEAARQVLFASYQNKIDLLNSVSERNELIASIR